MAEKNITLYFGPTNVQTPNHLKSSERPEYRILGNNAINADDTEHYFNISRDLVIGAGTHAQVGTYLLPSEQSMGRWHRSKEIISGFGLFGGFISNKKWHLNEVHST